MRAWASFDGAMVDVRARGSTHTRVGKTAETARRGGEGEYLQVLRGGGGARTRVGKMAQRRGEGKGKVAREGWQGVCKTARQRKVDVSTRG